VDWVGHPAPIRPGDRRSGVAQGGSGFGPVAVTSRSGTQFSHVVEPILDRKPIELDGYERDHLAVEDLERLRGAD